MIYSFQIVKDQMKRVENKKPSKKRVDALSLVRLFRLVTLTVTLPFGDHLTGNWQVGVGVSPISSCRFNYKLFGRKIQILGRHFCKKSLPLISIF
jgi:hypothetical protein